MTIRIENDAKAPTAAIELTIRRPLPDSDIEEVEQPVPRALGRRRCLDLSSISRHYFKLSRLRNAGCLTPFEASCRGGGYSPHPYG